MKDQSKLILYSFLGVMVGAILVFSLYGVKYFSAQTRETENRSQEITNKLASLEPKIIVPADNCDLPAGYVKNNFYVNLRSANVDKFKSSVEDLIADTGGTITRVNDNIYTIDDNAQRQVSFSVLLTPDKFRDFVTAIKKKIITGPSFVENENLSQITENDKEANCRIMLGMIKEFSQQEEIYLTQFQPNASFEDKQSFIDTLTDLRRKAIDQATNINNLYKDLDKSEINITINEILG